MKLKIFEQDLDKVLAILGIITALVLILYLGSVQFSLRVSRIIYIIPAFIILGFSTLWLLSRNKDLKFDFKSNQLYYKIISIIFFIFLVLSLIIYQNRPDIYIRPFSFFLLISAMVALISIEIIYIPNRPKYWFFTLLKIIIVGITLITSELMLFPNVLGVDPWFHQMFTTQIINLGYIPQDNLYSQVPGFHVLISEISIVTGLDYKLSVFFSVSILQVIINSFLIFILGKSMFNERVGLLSALFLNIGNIFLSFGFWTIPNTLGGIFLIVLLFVVIMLKNGISKSILIILLSVALIATHALVSMNLAILLFITFFGASFYKKYYSKYQNPQNINLTLAILFTVMMFAWWAYISQHLSELGHWASVGFTIEKSIPTLPAEISGYVVRLPLNEQFLNSLGMFSFFGISIFGLLLMVSKKYGNSKTFIFALCGAVTLFIGYVPFITGFSFIENRWWYVAQILFSIPLSVSIISLTNLLKFNKSFIIGSFSFLFAFLMITSVAANMDNHLLSPNTAGRTAFISSELQAFDTLDSISNKKIDGDWFMHDPIEFKLNHDFESIDNSILSTNFKENENDLIVIRDEILKNPFATSYGTFKLKNNPKIVLNNDFSKIYSSGTTDGFVYD